MSEPKLPSGRWTPETVRLFNSLSDQPRPPLLRGFGARLFCSGCGRLRTGCNCAIEAEYRDVTGELAFRREAAA